VTQRERESASPGSAGDRDAHSLLFGDHDDPEHAAPISRAERRRGEYSRNRRRRRRGTLLAILTIVFVAAAAVVIYKVALPRLGNLFGNDDYSGGGYGSQQVTIQQGATLGDIGDTLAKADVVKSAGAFTDAASAEPKAQSIQPGTYTLRKHMSGKAALAALLDPASRVRDNDLTIPEGATSLDVKRRIIAILGADQQQAVDKALASGADLGLPLNYTGKGDGVPTSAEGFLYPATYTIDPGSSAQSVLQTMVSRYLSQDRSDHFADDAKKAGITPYQALIIASIAQSEAKFPEDMPKVARTILNRIKIGRPLQFDSTSSYACKLQGVPADKCIYNQIDSAYNTYMHAGLPPTPIDNPGAEAMDAAVHPASGDWLYFVNKDSAGHLYFTSDEKAFAAAADKCRKNNWGCG
jgi:UPF0755 protein